MALITLAHVMVMMVRPLSQGENYELLLIIQQTPHTFPSTKSNLMIYTFKILEKQFIPPLLSARSLPLTQPFGDVILRHT
jgi:hypothetical protein